MPTRQRLSTSAGAIYLDRDARIRALSDAAQRAKARLSTIRRIVLFGSLARGVPTPRSDADLLVVLEASDQAPRERVPAMLAALAPLPCPVDLIIVTVTELAEAERQGTALAREALTAGIDLLSPTAS